MAGAEKEVKAVRGWGVRAGVKRREEEKAIRLAFPMIIGSVVASAMSAGLVTLPADRLKLLLVLTA